MHPATRLLTVLPQALPAFRMVQEQQNNNSGLGQQRRGKHGGGHAAGQLSQGAVTKLPSIYDRAFRQEFRNLNKGGVFRPNEPSETGSGISGRPSQELKV